MFVTNNDKYTIIKKIGQGGQANVYLASDKKGQMIKIKEFDKTKVKSFETEMENLKILCNPKSYHPNISCYLDSFIHEEKYYLVMKYYDGVDLYQIGRNLYKTYGIKYYDVLLDLLIKLLKTLEYIHQYGIIHGDIKLENIMILNQKSKDKKLIPVLIDFGSSCYIYDKSCMTTSGTTIYWPPEVAYYHMNNNHYDGLNELSDIWSLGVCFYELIYGEFIPKQLYNNMDISKYIIKNKKIFKFNTPNKLLNILLENMLVYDHKKRLSSRQLLNMLCNQNL